jgi:transposase InsO family protein
MRDLFLLAVQLIVTLAKLARPGGVRSVIAESLLLKHQLIISGRSRRRAPPLTTIDRFVLGLMTLFVRPRRVATLAAVLKPATLLRFHRALVDRKYHRLFSSAGTRRKPGPKGPTLEIISAILEMKLRNPRFGNQRIAQQISHAFGVQIYKDVVRRVLAKRYGPKLSGASGPSWLIFFAQAKDSLWSVDLFRCESILLRSHWVLVVIDVCTRRIIGFGIGGEYIDGPAVCRMFNHAIAGHAPPARISTDHDPLFRFHRWLANLRILEIEEIKSVPFAPMSHPFIERLIGTIRRKCLDHTVFWNSIDLHRKLDKFQAYYNPASYCTTFLCH